MSETSTDFHIGNGSYINMKTSSMVRLDEQFVIYTPDGPVTLRTEVTADFATIDRKYHEIFFNVLS